MKKIRVVVLVVVLIAVIVWVMPFGRLSGTYTPAGGGLTYTFKGNKVTYAMQEFPYKIEDGQLKIIMGVQSFNQSFEKDGNSIFISGVEYVKQ